MLISLALALSLGYQQPAETLLNLELEIEYISEWFNKTLT